MFMSYPCLSSNSAYLFRVLLEHHVAHCIYMGTTWLGAYEVVMYGCVCGSYIVLYALRLFF